MNEHVPRFSSEYQRVVYTDKDDSLSTQVYVRYQRVYKGIPVLGAGIYVVVDGTGEVIGYGSSGYEFENKLVEDLSPRINADRAKQIMVDAYRLKLIYSFDKNRRSSDAEKRPLALYYVAEAKEPYAGTGRYVDAVQGIRIKDELSETVRGGPLPAAYQKHPSSKAMQLLYDHGVIEFDDNGKIYPDKAISRLVFWKMINVSSTRYTPSSSAAAFSDTPVGREANNILMFAVQRGWLLANPKGKFNPNTLLTREQMAVWLTSVIGYGKLSFQFSEDPVVTRLKDAGTIKDKGAAALMLKLGLMTAGGGNFNPKAPVTLAEAAETFKRLAEKQNELDHPLYSYE